MVLKPTARLRGIESKLKVPRGYRLLFNRTNLAPAMALVAALFLAGAAVLAQTPATPAQLTVQFVARGLYLPPQEETPVEDMHRPTFGHVFMIISIPTLHGPKEEAYGFYSAKDSGKAMIKGPGMMKSEFRCGAKDDCSPEKFGEFVQQLSKTEKSVRVPITEEQRKMIASDAAAWNSKDYDWTTQNCMDFLNVVVQHLGYPPVNRYRTQTPEIYLRALDKDVVAEDARREIQKQREQQEAIEAAKQRLIEAEKRRRNDEYFIQISNIDDKMTAELNGQIVLSVQDGRDSGRVKLSLQPDHNRLVVRLYNLVANSGVSYSFKIWKNSQEIGGGSCGTYHVAACGGERAIYGIGQVQEWSFDLN
jgi:hypothetical protein